MASLPSVPAVARAQHGAFTRAQAHAAGWTNRQLAGAVQRGLLVQRHPGVFVLAGSRRRVCDDAAAYLTAGPGAVLAGWSAARLHSLAWPQRPGGPPCVAVPPDRHLHLAGVVVVRSRLTETDTLVRGGLRVTTRPRTVVDCLRLAPRVLREPMLDTALVRGWLTLDELAAQVRALTGQHGVVALRGLLSGALPRTWSPAERLGRQVLQRTGLEGWRWNLPVGLPDGSVAVVDAALPQLRLAVEIDGRAHHVDPAAFQRDRRRQNGLVALGWLVLRFTWDDLVRRPDEVVASVLAAVALRAA